MYLLQKRFRLDDSSDMEHAKRVFHNTAKKVVKDAISNSRLQAVNQVLKSKGQSVLSFRQASDVYLSEEEYAGVRYRRVMVVFLTCCLPFDEIVHVQVTIPWMEGRPDAYRAFCQRWSSPDWIAKSMKHRASRGEGGGHKYGADGHQRMKKRMVR
jgi:hypothetical protein